MTSKKYQAEYRIKNADQIKARRKEYYEKNKEREKENRRKYYYENREKELLTGKKYKERHPEKIKEIRRAYYQSHSEIEKENSKRQRLLLGDKKKEYMKDWHLKNKEKEREYEFKNRERLRATRKRWKERNRDKVKVYSINHNAKRRSLVGGNVYVGVKIIRSLWDKQDGKCFYCLSELEKYHVDHYIPLARGGKHEEENLRLACPDCNHRKHAKMPDEFIKQIAI